MRRWTAERIERLRLLHAQGLSYTEIGEILGVSKMSVGGVVNRLINGRVYTHSQRKHVAYAKFRKVGLYADPFLRPLRTPAQERELLPPVSSIAIAGITRTRLMAGR